MVVAGLGFIFTDSKKMFRKLLQKLLQNFCAQYFLMMY